MLNDTRFLNVIAKVLFNGHMSPDQRSGTLIILEAFKKHSYEDTAYALATSFHETAAKMQPVREAYWLSTEKRNEYLRTNYDVTGRRPSTAKKYGNTQPGDGIKYSGRGHVQLTWKTNYRKAEKALGFPLVEQPDLALKPEISALILERGMTEGWFTGKKLADYINEHSCDFVNARRIINGTDKAVEIADLANKFLIALRECTEQAPVVQPEEPKQLTMWDMFKSWWRS
jgi:putative chitinase